MRQAKSTHHSLCFLCRVQASYSPCCKSACTCEVHRSLFGKEELDVSFKLGYVNCGAPMRCEGSAGIPQPCRYVSDARGNDQQCLHGEYAMTGKCYDEQAARMSFIRFFTRMPSHAVTSVFPQNAQASGRSSV
jgi:hypothetical protein